MDNEAHQLTVGMLASFRGHFGLDENVEIVAERLRRWVKRHTVIILSENEVIPLM